MPLTFRKRKKKRPQSKPKDFLAPDILLSAYAMGMFPMAVPEEDNEIYWFSPDPRAIIPLDEFHIPHNLKKIYYRKKPFELRINTAFGEVIQACANRSGNIKSREQETTWISSEIIRAYSRLHRLGFAHSVESWQEGKLVGGLYGVALGSAFFGESMFSYVSEASKVALVYLVERMRERGYTILDTQYSTGHLARFGLIEISKKEYLKRLDRALEKSCSFDDRFRLLKLAAKSKTPTSESKI